MSTVGQIEKRRRRVSSHCFAIGWATTIWAQELAKKPVQCLEYIVAHKLAHLLERHHDERFTTLLVR
jgi:predicted metal-dependent hydrolase